MVSDFLRSFQVLVNTKTFLYKKKCRLAGKIETGISGNPVGRGGLGKYVTSAILKLWLRKEQILQNIYL